jgi:hypothetical protein
MSASLKELIGLSKWAIGFADAVVGTHGGAINKVAEIRKTTKIETGHDAFDKHVSESAAEMVYADIRSRIDRLRKEFAAAYPHGPEPWNAAKLNKLALLAIKHRAGHCNEQVAIVFHHLRGKGVKTLDFMFLTPYPYPADHSFLIINRGMPNAVVCDPWSPWKNYRAYAATPKNLGDYLKMHTYADMESAFTWHA